MLPPDNFQEDPKPVVARRTSPTNIGLYLLCIANARDFGWTGLTDAVDRLEATMATLARCSDSAAISSIGTTPMTCARSSRDTCRRSTAATWPVICSPWPTLARVGDTTSQQSASCPGWPTP